MTPGIIAIIAAAITLAGLILALFQIVNKRLDSLERRMERGFEALEGRHSASEQHQAALGERQARLEGLMEAIRDLLLRTPAAP